MSDPLKIVIGFDRSEVAAYHALCNSILNRSSKPLFFMPLYLPQLEVDNLMWRKDRGSTDFSFSRFLTPYLAGYKGLVLFMDCDFVCRADISQLFDEMPLDKCVGVVKHDYRPTNATKFLGNPQHAYPKKLWSSLMMFNCASARVKSLTPKIVNEAEGSYLHQFEWTADHRIHGFDESWNFIPGHSEGEPKMIHYTEGGPWFKDYRGVPHASEWMAEHAAMCQIETK